MSDEVLEADRVEGAPHPRETHSLLGQDSAQAAFLDAFNTGRLHHGWLITGPRGVGKATLAWRIARFLLTQPTDDGGGLFGDAPPAPATLDTATDHPVCHRMTALSEPRLFLLRRAVDDKKGKLKTVITVDEARKLKNFFALSAAEGGRRVVIVDAADEMNPNAANALLKLLEEPPEDAVILLISHQPSRLLPTIRSRCRELRLATLSPDDMAAALQNTGQEIEGSEALATLSGGSVGEAIRLANLDGLTLYSEITAAIGPLDRPRMLKLAETAATRGGEPRFDLMLRLFELFLVRLARTGVAGPPCPEATTGEAQLMTRLCPDAQAARLWADLAQTLSARARQGKAVNLDPAALILDTVLKIDDTAHRVAERQSH